MDSSTSSSKGPMIKQLFSDTLKIRILGKYAAPGPEDAKPQSGAIRSAVHRAGAGRSAERGQAGEAQTPEGKAGG